MVECTMPQTETLLATDSACRERLRRAADHARLARLARGPRDSVSAIDDMLVGLGEALIWAGEKLMVRHSTDARLTHHRTV